MSLNRQAWSFPFVVLAGCASSGVDPHAMSATQHEATAKSEEQAAMKHAARYDPSDVRQPYAAYPFPYAGGAGGWCAPYSRAFSCYPYWNSVANPTERHLADAATHRDLAEKHRAASQALRDVETRACAGVPEADRDMSPFNHREDIERVEPIDSPAIGRTPARALGARVVFRALPGMTAEWLQRVVNCHLARNAVIGHDAPEMAYCPLALKDVAATVRSTGDGFGIEVTSSDVTTAQQIRTHAEKLVGP